MARATGAASVIRVTPRTRASCSPSGVLGGASLQYSLAERVPVGARAQLAERREHEALHAADQQRLRRDRLAPHLLEEVRARARAARSIRSVT